MKKLVYLFIAILSVGIISCESEYDDGLDVSSVHPAYIYLSNTADKIATETKSLSVSITRVIPIYEDVTVSYEISGEGFSSFSGETVFPKTTGQSGTNTHTFTIDIPAAIVPGGEVSTDGTFTLVSCEAASGTEVAAGLKGKDVSFNMTINKYVPLDRTPFLGEAMENDGMDDYPVTINADPDDEFGFIITGGNWGPGASYKVSFNTITNETLVSTQYIGVNYFAPGLSSDYDAIYYAPGSENGTFDISNGSFTVVVNMGLPNYPYDFGEYTLSYSKE
jgi:hypothetical protein